MEPQSSQGAVLPLCFFLGGGGEEPVFHPRRCPLFRKARSHSGGGRAPALPWCLGAHGTALHSQPLASCFPSQVRARSRPPAAVALPGGGLPERGLPGLRILCPAPVRQRSHPPLRETPALSSMRATQRLCRARAARGPHLPCPSHRFHPSPREGRPRAARAAAPRSPLEPPATCGPAPTVPGVHKSASGCKREPPPRASPASRR